MTAGVKSDIGYAQLGSLRPGPHSSVNDYRLYEESRTITAETPLDNDIGYPAVLLEKLLCFAAFQRFLKERSATPSITPERRDRVNGLLL